jgi:conjugative relaxase-like TrwC/TraI family protein
VLTIGKLGRSRGRLEYYEAQVAAGAEDYYAGRGESPGRWRGTGARALGLPVRGLVERVGFMRLMAGSHPADGSVLRAVGARSTVAGFDLTFSAPKSVSVLFAIADEALAGELLAAHEHAVDAALVYLERGACVTRRGHDGVERVRGEGFVAASYRHRMSRAGDPQLHTHVVVGNLTRAEGRFTALDGRALYEHKSAGGAVYRAVLRARVRERLSWAVWRAVGRGLFELDGVPDGVLRHFSTRRVEIEERAAELVGAGAGAVGGLSRERMQGIALATRRAKTYGVDGGSWRDQARARAGEHGLGRREMEALAARTATAESIPDLRAAGRVMPGPEGLTAHHNTFARRHALAEMAGGFVQGASLQELERATSGYLAGASVVQLLASGSGEERFTTVELLALERDLVEGAVRRAGETVGVIDPREVARALASHEPPLNADQAEAVRRISRSGRGVEVVTALAGTGKTTLVGALATAYRNTGWEVIGTAPTARAARQLREQAGIQATTMHALLHRLTREGGLHQRTVLVIDEAAMAPTRQSAALLAHAELAGVKVIAIGDPGQLPSVEAGGWLAALADHQDGPQLRQVLRQADPEHQQVLEALHDGDPVPYLTHHRDRVEIHQTEVGALLHARDVWSAAYDRHGPREAVMIARENLTRERLNHAARALLKQQGRLEQRGVWIGGREYSPGDRVIARQNDHRADIDNGTQGTVLAVDPDTLTVILQTDSGQTRALQPSYVSEHLEHAYAVTGHAAQGATVTWAAVIGRPGDFTREWAYTALSRARQHTSLHLISEPAERELEREQYAPAQPPAHHHETLQALQRAMRKREAEPLAIQQLQTKPSQNGTRTATCCPPSPELAGLQNLRQSHGIKASIRLHP